MGGLKDILIETKRLTEEWDGGTLYGYHVTRNEHLDGIRDNGFKIGSGKMQGEGVYSFYELEHAIRYGGKDMGDDTAIVKFEITNPHSILIINTEIAKQVLGDKYHFKDQIDNMSWSNGWGFEGFLKGAQSVYEKDITAEQLLAKLEEIENNNIEGNQRTIWSYMIPGTDSNKLDLLHNGNYGIEFRINHPWLMLPLGYYQLGRGQDGVGELTPFEDKAIPDTEEYQELKRQVEETGKTLIELKAYFEQRQDEVRNNREFDYYHDQIEKINKLLRGW